MNTGLGTQSRFVLLRSLCAPICLLAVASALLITATGRAVGADDEPADNPRDLLEEKGIRVTRTEAYLEKEQELSSEMRTSRRLKSAVLKASRAQEQVEQVDEQHEKRISALVNQYGKFNAQLQNANQANVFVYNQLVSKVNQASAAIKLAEEARRKHFKQLEQSRKETSEAREEFIQCVLKMRSIVDELDSEYDLLNEDAEIKAAIEEINGDDGSVTFGPSRSLAGLVRRLETLEESVITEAIPLDQEGLSYFVSAVFNGEHTERLVVDSGANVVSLSRELAERLGVDTGGDPVVLRVADGRTVEATRAVIDSLRVGQFEIENVDAVVVKQSAQNVPALLGMSFLRHFKFELNADAATLTLTKIGDGSSKRSTRRRSRR